jgi:DNA-binding response OmpR family regulator
MRDNVVTFDTVEGRQRRRADTTPRYTQSRPSAEPLIGEAFHGEHPGSVRHEGVTRGAGSTSQSRGSDVSTNTHIVVVDDEEMIRDTVQEYLIRQGYTVSQADGGPALRALMADRPVDLVVLDINMPGEDGVTIARELRKGGRVGIVMLTANSDQVDKVVGLEVGADDYITKPFDPRELLARIRSVLRRATTEDTTPASLGREVRVGRCVLNLDSQCLFSAAGDQVPLTAMEFDLLKAFVDNPNRVLTRDRLLDLAHNKESEGLDRSIDTRITRIRRKVELDPATPQALKTVRGAGYIFVPGR